MSVERQGPGTWPDPAEWILDRVLLHRNTFPSAGATATEAGRARAAHVAKIRHFVELGKPIQFVLPAFPAKSPNPEKTLGPLPDRGEVVALQLLDSLCRDIAAVYPPGARVVICSDGRVFSDLVRVPDSAVDGYSVAVREILERYRLDRLSTFNLEDVFPPQPYDAMRTELVRGFAEPVETIRERVKTRDDDRELFNGIHRFLFEDQLVLDDHLSRNQVREQSKATAYQVVQRSNAWSRLVENEFPSALRLSIHPQPLHSAKIGIRLVPGGNLWVTPWHGVLLEAGQGFRLVKRREALAMNARLLHADGKYPYFSLSHLLGGES